MRSHSFFLGADSDHHYLSARFNAAGQLVPGGNTGEIQTRYNEINWAESSSPI